MIQNEKKADIITKKYGLEKDGYILFLARIVPGKRIALFDRRIYADGY